MGADLIVAAVAIRRNTKAKWADAEVAVDRLSAFDLDQAEKFGWSFEGIAEETEADELDIFRNNVRAALADVKEAWEGRERRDTTFLDFRSWSLMLTGGMTWGDDPSELYTSLCLVLNTRILDKAGFEPCKA